MYLRSALVPAILATSIAVSAFAKNDALDLSARKASVECHVNFTLQTLVTVNSDSPISVITSFVRTKEGGSLAVDLGHLKPGTFAIIAAKLGRANPKAEAKEDGFVVKAEGHFYQLESESNQDKDHPTFGCLQAITDYTAQYTL